MLPEQQDKSDLINRQRGGAPEFSGEMLGWVLSGLSVGPQRVLSEYSGYSWVLRLCIFEYSGGSQVGTSSRLTERVRACLIVNVDA